MQIQTCLSFLGTSYVLVVKFPRPGNLPGKTGMVGHKLVHLEFESKNPEKHIAKNKLS